VPCGSKERKRWYTWGELQQVAEQVRSFARALFVEARALLANGRISEACERLELSNARSATIGTLLNLGLCCVQLGRLGRAYEYYQRAHQAAVGRADSARAGVAGAELQRLAPMLGIITPITLSPSGSNTVEMVIDGEEQPKDAWGLAIYVDPGEHVLVVREGDGHSWSGVVRVSAGQQRLVVVPELKAARQKIGDVLAMNSDSASPSDSVKPPLTSQLATTLALTKEVRPAENAREVLWSSTSIGSQRAAALGAGAAAVLGAGATVVFSVLANAAYTESNAFCRPDGVCSLKGIDLRNDARGHEKHAIIVGSAGAAALVASGLLWLTATTPSERPSVGQNAGGRRL